VTNHIIDKHFREALLETVPCAIFMVDINNQIIFWNKSAEELTGYTVDEIVGSTCDKLRMSICISRDPAIMKLCARCFLGGKVAK